MTGVTSKFCEERNISQIFTRELVLFKEYGSLPHHIARRICLGHSISSNLIYVHSIGYILSLRVSFVI